MDEQIPLVVDLARWAARVGVGALIVADPGLIATLRKGGLKLPLHLSTMGVAANARSAGLFARQGITRVILPRFLDLAQIRALTKANPSMEYEAFVLVGKCPHIEGLCTFIHDSADQRWPCEWPWEAEETDGGSPQPAVSGYLAAMRENDRRDGCGLCALPALRAAGVSTFKVVGRGAPLERKVRLVEQLSRVLKEMPPEPDEAWRSMCRDTYRDLYGRLCSVHNCYYPEVHAREEGPGGRHP